MLRSLAAACLLVVPAVAVAQDKPSVVAVNAALQYLAEQLVQDDADVSFPVPDGVDPSFWRPSISDISEIQAADLIVLNGAGFATWVDRVSLPRSKLVNTSAAIEDQFIVTESITHSHGDGGEHSHEGVASYLWLDPTLAAAQADAIAAAIARKGIVSADEVYARLTTLQADLEAMDAAARTSLSGSQDVSMIATHPRYQYFARRYGVSIASLEWEAGSMPTDAELADLQKLVEDTGAAVLIWEAEPPAAAKEAVAAMGLESVTFNPLASGGGDLMEDFATSVNSLAEAVGRASDS